MKLDQVWRLSFYDNSYRGPGTVTFDDLIPLIVTAYNRFPEFCRPTRIEVDMDNRGDFLFWRLHDQGLPIVRYVSGAPIVERT